MKGKVYLVGGGPGDPELLTVKATKILGRANIVLHDALVSAEVLALIAPTAELIDVGKRAGRKLLTQDEINALLVSYAQSNEVVVRLKGGDPVIFGRLGEEVSALHKAGIEFEIVPGITAGIAAATAAGFSLTDRRFASQVLFTTMQRDTPNRAIQWGGDVQHHFSCDLYARTRLRPGGGAVARCWMAARYALRDYLACQPCESGDPFDASCGPAG